MENDTKYQVMFSITMKERYMFGLVVVFKLLLTVRRYNFGVACNRKFSAENKILLTTDNSTK